MKSINQFVTQLARESNLPFEVDIAPDPDAVPDSVVSVGKIHFPLFGEYTAGEQFFVEGIQAKNTLRAFEVQMVVQSLNKAIKAFFSVDTAAEVDVLRVRVLGGVPDELPAKDGQSSAITKVVTEAQISAFQDEHEDLLNKLLTLSVQTAGQMVMKMFLVTFFLKSRVDADWDFSNTSRMKVADLDEIHRLIRSEVEPNTQLETVDTPEDALNRRGKKQQKEAQSESNLIGLESTPILQTA